MTVKLLLSEVRTQRGLTQEELAQAVNMSLGGIQYLEYKATTIKFELLDLLCDALDCEPGDLIKRFDDQIEGGSLKVREKSRQKRSQLMKEWWAKKRQQPESEAHEHQDAA